MGAAQSCRCCSRPAAGGRTRLWLRRQATPDPSRPACVPTGCSDHPCLGACDRRGQRKSCRCRSSTFSFAEISELNIVIVLSPPTLPINLMACIRLDRRVVAPILRRHATNDDRHRATPPGGSSSSPACRCRAPDGGGGGRMSDSKSIRRERAVTCRLRTLSRRGLLHGRRPPLRRCHRCPRARRIRRSCSYTHRVRAMRAR